MPPQVPFGGAVTAALTNYNRTTPGNATGGRVERKFGGPLSAAEVAERDATWAP